MGRGGGGGGASLDEIFSGGGGMSQFLAIGNGTPPLVEKTLNPIRGWSKIKARQGLIKLLLPIFSGEDCMVPKPLAESV